MVYNELSDEENEIVIVDETEVNVDEKCNWMKCLKIIIYIIAIILIIAGGITVGTGYTNSGHILFGSVLMIIGFAIIMLFCCCNRRIKK